MEIISEKTNAEHMKNIHNYNTVDNGKFHNSESRQSAYRTLAHKYQQVSSESVDKPF